MLKRLLAVSALFLGLGFANSCGGDDDKAMTGVEACKKINSILCPKIFTCLSKAILDSPQAKSELGLNAGDCETKFNADCTEDNMKCDLGESYHADKAAQCANGYTGLSCNDISTSAANGTDWPEPAACSQVCTK